MSHFASFATTDGAEQVCVRLELDGRTEVVVSNPLGEVARHRDEIDPRDARRLITDLFDVAARATHQHDGPIDIQVGDGRESRSVRTSSYHLTRRGLEVERVIRMIANDVRAGYGTRSERHRGGPRRPKLTVVGFVGWTFAFAASFLLCWLIGNLGVVFGLMTGPYTFAISNTLALFLMSGSYYTIGLKFGEEYRGDYPVLLPAICATIPLLYAWITVAGVFSFFGLLFMCTLPVAAVQGDKMGY